MNLKYIFKIIDITNESNEYKKYFDIIVFKSVWGGVIIQKNGDKMFNNIKQMLKDDGVIIFCENLKGHLIHNHY